jgi:uncharacterized damage-inducible protein DinB
MTNREFFLQRRWMEAGMFQKVFEAVPGDKLDWRPEPKARTARELIGHLIGHEQDLVELLQRGEIHHRMQVPFGNVPEAVALYRKACQDAEAGLRALGDDTWDAGKAKFIVGTNVVVEAPRRDLGWLLLCDSIHHRGQLSTYLRPMGSKVPAMYGPSADDSGAG